MAHSFISWNCVCVLAEWFVTDNIIINLYYTQDLAKLFLWVLRDYEEVDPIILSGRMLQCNQ